MSKVDKGSKQEQEGTNVYDKIVSDVKAISQMDDRDAKADSLSDLLSLVASNGVNIVTSHKDVGFTTATYFAGFTAVALTLNEDQEGNAESTLETIKLICAMCTNAIMKKENEVAEGGNA